MEKQLQYLWQHRLWKSSSMITTGGTPIEILDPGVPNHDAGPDFFNGKVRARGRTWAGNIEIHVRSSDWYRHGHQHDSSYDSVILHVVGEADCDVRRSDCRSAIRNLPCRGRSRHVQPLSHVFRRCIFPTG